MPGACNQDGAVYQETVSTDDGREESYVGLAKNFKKRFMKHRATLKSKNADGQTTLSRYVWEQRERQMNPTISWKMLEKNIPDFNPVSEICKLCTREKFQIVLNPGLATLNRLTLPYLKFICYLLFSVFLLVVLVCFRLSCELPDDLL